MVDEAEVDRRQVVTLIVAGSSPVFHPCHRGRIVRRRTVYAVVAGAVPVVGVWVARICGEAPRS